MVESVSRSRGLSVGFRSSVAERATANREVESSTPSGTVPNTVHTFWADEKELRVQRNQANGTSKVYAINSTK